MDNQWITEQLHPFYKKSLYCRKVLVDEQTNFQHIQIVETEYFGKALILDGIIQLTELDNAGYHEMIVHVPMLANHYPKRVLIVGGGDGGSLQQVLRYSSVEEAVVCELDARVVEICDEHFPKFGHPFSDSRVTLVVNDAFKYLEQNDKKFDVIISDTTDPVGEAEKLFSEDFYKLMWASLNPGGTIATQCEQMFFDAQLINRIYRFAQALCKNPSYYYALVPTYPGGGIGFLYASDVHWSKGLERPYPQGKMHYINHGIHQAAFELPEFFKNSFS